MGEIHRNLQSEWERTLLGHYFMKRGCDNARGSRMVVEVVAEATENDEAVMAIDSGCYQLEGWRPGP